MIIQHDYNDCQTGNFYIEAGAEKMTSTVSMKNQVLQSEWYRSLSRFEKPDIRKSVGQILNTIVPYFALWILMVYMVHHKASLWFLAPLTLLSAGLLVRIFIIMHDCGHGSFFASHKANRILGYVCGILVFTPYEDWRHKHAEHHATSGDLERRGVGDIFTMTVEEYKAAPRLKQIGYRIYRNPFIMLVIGPPLLFLFFQRFYSKNAKPRERNSVIITNLAILAIIALAYWTIGLKTYFLIQLPIIIVAAALGVWMFYVQHQYESVYWAHHQEWDPFRAALEGSSYFRLPPILQWFSGNIGLHHIHHLRSRIANYHLQQSYNEIPELQAVQPLTIRTSFKCLTLNLYDEAQRRLVSFRSLQTN